MRSHAKGPSAGSILRYAMLVLSALLALVCVPTALAAPEYELRGGFGPDGTVSTEFSEGGPIAVDQQADHVYFLDRGDGSLYKFDLEGNAVPWGGSAPYISGNEIGGISILVGSGGAQTSQLAVDSTSHKVYVTDGNSIRALQANGEPALFSAGPGAGTNLIGDFAELSGLAVDANGFIYASELGADLVKIFAPSGEEVTQFSVTDPRHLAVDSTGAVYVVRLCCAPLKHTPSAFPVTGATTYTPAPQPLPNSSETYAIAVDPATNDVYTTRSGLDSKITVYDEDGTLLTTFAGEGQEGDLVITSNGIAVDGDSTAVFVSRNPEGFAPEIPPQVLIFDLKVIFEGPPSVESTSALAITADSATLRAWINPNTAASSYRFEYGLQDCAVSACTSVPIGGAEIAAGQEPVMVAQPISGLQAGTTYHYRVVAENSFDPPTEGPDTTFVTQSPGLGFVLADNRAWEMVSPPNKHGAELLGAQSSLIQAAASGEGLVYGSRGSIEADPEASRSFEGASVLARRSSDGSWRSKDISPPSADPAPLPLGLMVQHKFFSADLSRAVLEPRGSSPLSPQASERTPYLTENTEPPTYLPFVTGKEGFANVPPGTIFGGTEIVSSVRFEGATPDFDHVVLNSKVPLIEGAPTGPNENLYLWTGGELSPVSVRPASEGGAMPTNSQFGSGSGSVRNAISHDGSRIFWSAGSYTSAGNALTGLYVRDALAEDTARLDVAQPGASGTGASSPVFQGANTDGTVVFFTSGQQLTEGASFKGRDLYRCEIPPGPADGCASLTNLSALPGSGKRSDVLGLATGMSEDGTRIYFVAKGALVSDPNEFGDSAVAGEPNLYLWQEAEGVRFVATLSEGDAPVWGGNGSPTERTATMSSAGSPSGRYLAFMSQRSLAGDENLDATSGEPVQQAYRYDALADRLHCVSCNPSGAAPEGQLAGLRVLVDPQEQWKGRLTAAILPQAITTGLGRNSLHQARGMLENGRVLFNSFGSLVPADSNGEWDVYEWEPLGVGDCTSSSGGAATSRSGQGCVSLLSSGTAEEEAGFIDASLTGDDVFFFTDAKLSVTDEDEELDVYDARANGIAAKLTPRSECQGEACQPPAIPPADFTPASSAFEGQGNVRPAANKRCAKRKRKVRRAGKVRCVAREQARKKQRKARTGNERRVAR